jgi:hypothetical protein
MTRQGTCPYTTRLQKGGALLDDMRALVRTWQNGAVSTQREEGVRANLLAKQSRSRITDIYQESFLPRFVRGPVPNAWRIVRPLEDRQLPIEVLRPVYYWITARSEAILYEFATEWLYERMSRGERVVTPNDTVSWIKRKLRAYGKSWSEPNTLRVAQGVLAALRDFGILEGRAKKRIAPVHLPLEAFAYLMLTLHLQGPSGERLVHHQDWKIFLLTPEAVEHLLLNAHQRHLLGYHAAGKLVRIEFPTDSLEAMADGLASGAN